MYVQHNTLARWRYHNKPWQRNDSFLCFSHCLAQNGKILRREKEILNKKLGVLIFYTNFA
jgi:hypothetical protein